MSEALAVAPTSFSEVESLAPAVADKKDFASLAKLFDFLPYMQLAYNIDLVNQRKVALGNFVLRHMGDKFDDLGTEVLGWPLAWRAAAMDSRGEKPIFYYDKNSEGFKQMFALRDVKDSKCMAGPQFLIYIPKYGFATFFMASKSARNEAPELEKLLPAAGKEPDAFLITCQELSNPDYNWLSPKVVKSTQVPDRPDMAEYLEVRKAFLNPKPTVAPEAAPAGAVAEDRG